MFSFAHPPWRQPRGKWMVSLVNSYTDATPSRWHLWEIDFRFALNSTPGWPGASRRRRCSRNGNRTSRRCQLPLTLLPGQRCCPPPCSWPLAPSRGECRAARSSHRCGTPLFIYTLYITHLILHTPLAPRRRRYHDVARLDAPAPRSLLAIHNSRASSSWK